MRISAENTLKKYLFGMVKVWKILKREITLVTSLLLMFSYERYIKFALGEEFS